MLDDPLPVPRVVLRLPPRADAHEQRGGTGGDIGLDQQLWLDRTLFSLAPDYLLKVQGDSMVDDGILDGDLVGVHRTSEARNGQVVVARVDGEITIKRFERGRKDIRLLPRNPAHAPIVVEPHQDFAIEGVYCGLVRQG